MASRNCHTLEDRTYNFHTVFCVYLLPKFSLRVPFTVMFSVFPHLSFVFYTSCQSHQFFFYVRSLPKEYTVRISSLCNWLHYLITFFLLGLRFTFILCSETSSLCVLAIVRVISHLSNAKNEIRISVCFNLKALVCKSSCGRNCRRTFCCILVTKIC